MAIETNRKSYEATDQRVAASDEAVAAGVTGSAASNGISLGGFLSSNQVGGIRTDMMGKTISGGVEVTGNNSAPITINQAAGVEALGKEFSSVLDTLAESSNNIVQDALSKVTALSESKQTDGVSSLGRLALWGLGIVVVGVLGFFLLGGKAK